MSMMAGRRIDGEGNLLSNEPDGGYKTYDDWEQLILRYLNG